MALTLMPAEYYGNPHNALHPLAGTFRSVKSSVSEVLEEHLLPICWYKVNALYWHKKIFLQYLTHLTIVNNLHIFITFVHFLIYIIYII